MEQQLILSDGQQLARTRWGTHASGAAFDRKKFSYLTEQAQTFIARQNFCVIAGEDAQHRLCGLIVPGVPGFVQVFDERTCVVSLPDTLSTTRLAQNVLHSLESGWHCRLALFFISHLTRERLCVHGAVTSITGPSSVQSDWMQLDRATALHIRVHQSFFHCSKYIRTHIAGLTCPAEVYKESTWRVERVLKHASSYLSESLCAYIADHTMCYLCTIDRYGQPAINHRGGASGFLVTRLPDNAYPGGRILLPDYTGNGAFEAIGNIFETGKVALIVPDYAAQLAVGLAGSAQVLELSELPDELAGRCIGAERVVALSVERVEVQAGDWSAALAAERTYAAALAVGEDEWESCSVS